LLESLILDIFVKGIVMDDLRKFSLDIIKKNPELGGEIVDLFAMMMDEVEDGSSEELERDRFVCSVEELVNAKEEVRV
jgi:hypothetical protein